MRAGTVRIVVLAAFFVGCKTEPSATKPFPEIGSQAAPSATIFFAVPAPSRPFGERMKEHATLGIEMRDAVVHGDVAGAREAAGRLAGLRVDAAFEPALVEKADAMKSAAGRAREAQDVREAARGVADVARTCGECHARFGGPKAAEPAGPADTGFGAKATMARHRWAAARLWQGLATPSGDAWTGGASALVDAPLAAERLTPGKTPVAELDALALSLRGHARRALTAQHPEERARIYGDMLETCAACHQRSP
jgi:cytochrome c553